MTPDIKFKNYYLQFINDAKIDYAKYKELLQMSLDILEDLYSFISDNKNIILDKYNINVEDYEIEWINKTYNPDETLYKKVFKTFQTLDEDTNKSYLLQIIKYCQTLSKVAKYKKLMELTFKRKELKFGQYRTIVCNYYNKVHKCVLEGNGYKFAKGLGTYCINYWKLDSNNIKKKVLDYAASNARKKELLKQGIKLYDQKEADWYKARNIPYNGVDYRIFKDDDHWYEITFINSKLFKKSKAMEYKHTEYIVANYRGMSYMQIADEFVNDINDIYTLQVDIKYKLNILLYKYPTKYLNFIRNVEQRKYKHRENYCQNR